MASVGTAQQPGEGRTYLFSAREATEPSKGGVGSGVREVVVLGDKGACGTCPMLMVVFYCAGVPRAAQLSYLAMQQRPVSALCMHYH